MSDVLDVIFNDSEKLSKSKHYILLKENSTNMRIVPAKAALVVLMPSFAMKKYRNIRMTSKANQNNQSIVVRPNHICHQ